MDKKEMFRIMTSQENRGTRHNCVERIAFLKEALELIPRINLGDSFVGVVQEFSLWCPLGCACAPTIELRAVQSDGRRQCALIRLRERPLDEASLLSKLRVYHDRLAGAFEKGQIPAPNNGTPE